MPAPRILSVDAARGFALFGVLAVNASHFFNPWDSFHHTQSPLDRFVEGLIALLFDSKAYPILAFLFGFGLKAHSLGMQARRLATLALIGFGHAVLLWTGDILVLYAVAGSIAVVSFGRLSPGSAIAR